MKRVLLILLSIMCAEFSYGVGFDYKGFADTYYAFQMKGNNKYNALRSRFRGELFSQIGDAYLFTSINAISNNTIKDDSDVNLHELYLEYVGSSWDIRIGRQIITWGKADGLQITDIICPGDFTEFITRDFDDIRIPVDALKFRYMTDLTNVEIIWQPFFKNAILPGGNSPWAIPLSIDRELYNLPKLPEKSLKNCEIAGKISFFLSGIDFAFSGFYTWDDLPIVHEKRIDGRSQYCPEYHRVSFLGFEINKPINDFVIRSEVAFYHDKYMRSLKTKDKTDKKDLLKKMIGLDWYPGNDWTCSAQIANDLILDYQHELVDDENNTLITLNISKKICRQTLEISNMIYFGINESDFYEKIAIDYALTDEFHVSCGADIFSGEKGKFGRYEDNSQVWMKGKFNF